MNQCRICKKANFESPEPLVKYAVRHHVHFSCALAKWGADFLNKLSLNQIREMPFRLVDQYQLRNHPRLIASEPEIAKKA